MNTAKKLLAKLSGVGALMAASIGAAHAELPEVVGTTLATVKADGLALADLVWPILLALFGVALLMKLTKRFGGKI